jgi:hypothetical protein
MIFPALLLPKLYIITEKEQKDIGTELITSISLPLYCTEHEIQQMFNLLPSCPPGQSKTNKLVRICKPDFLHPLGIKYSEI